MNEPVIDMLMAMAGLAEGEHKRLFLLEAKAKSGLSGDAIQSIAQMVSHPKVSKVKAKSARNLFVEIPLVVGRAGAGPAFFLETDEVEGHLSIPRSVCPNPAETRCIKIFGDSMEPTIPNGTIAAVDGSQKRVEKLRGKIIAVRHEVEGVKVKRLEVFEGKDVLASDKRGHPTFDLEPDWKIVGRVVWWIQTA